MKKSVGKIVDYLVLSLFVSLAIVLILIFNGNKVFQMATIIGLSVVYLFWGILHHRREGTHHPKVTLEYFLFAILGTILVLALL